MTLVEKLNNITDDMLNTYPLIPGQMEVPSHHCVLNQKDKDHNGNSNCDKIKGAHKCLSGLTDFY
jgi:hypothetical protein